MTPTGKKIAVGTGFIYEHEDFYYLITNGHNITAVNPETGMRLTNSAAFPVYIDYNVRVVTKSIVIEYNNATIGPITAPPGGPSLMSYPGAKIILPLYADEDYLQPVWYMHPKFGHKVDVIAIPLRHKNDMPGYVNIYPINTYSEFKDTRLFVADDVYVIGYPFGADDDAELPTELPIWKRASIASEPDMFYKMLPRFLIDTATRPGMSGSPVVLLKTGRFRSVDSGSEELETVQDFIGIYSGRIGEESNAQLGLVWRKEVIVEIIEGKVLGTASL